MPTGVVFQTVVTPAHVREVLDRGLSAVLPILRVIDVAIGGGAIASGRSAGSITYPQRPAKIRRYPI